MIRFDSVTFGYGRRGAVLHNFSLDIQDESRICLSGPSGCGKTTVLRLALGLESPRKGKVMIPEGTRFSAVFQEDRLLPWRSVLDNVTLFADGETARKMLQRLGLEGHENEPPAELSGGMRRRVALARALCHPFDVLILDEAFTGIDDDTKERCLDAVRGSIEGKILIMATHDLREAAALDATVVEMPVSGL